MIKDIVFTEIYGRRIDKLINRTFEDGVTYGMHQMMHLIEQFEDKKIPVTSDGIKKYFEQMKQEAAQKSQSTSQSTPKSTNNEIITKGKETPQVVSLFPKKD